MSQDDGKSKFQSKTADVMTGYSTVMIPVTITAGVDKLSAAPGATATGTNTNAAPTASTGSSPTSTPTGTDKGTSAASTSTTSGNAAAAMVTQNAVLAGVAAVVGGAMML